MGVRSEPEMSTTDALSSLSDVIVMNGDSGGHSNGPQRTEASTAPSMNLETATALLHQRDNSLENIYNLYAISVSASKTAWRLAS